MVLKAATLSLAEPVRFFLLTEDRKMNLITDIALNSRFSV